MRVLNFAKSTIFNEHTAQLIYLRQEVGTQLS